MPVHQHELRVDQLIGDAVKGNDICQGEGMFVLHRLKGGFMCRGWR